MDVDWSLVVSHLIHLGIAYLLALPVAWNRERESHSAGLRTFPLVALAACGYMLVGMSVFQDEVAQSRALYGIVTGIGFIGGGAILKENGGVHGTATAASIWNTGAIGVAVAVNRYEIAIVLSVLNIVTLFLGDSLKSRFVSDEKCDDRDTLREEPDANRKAP